MAAALTAIGVAFGSAGTLTQTTVYAALMGGAAAFLTTFFATYQTSNEADPNAPQPVTADEAATLTREIVADELTNVLKPAEDLEQRMQARVDAQIAELEAKWATTAVPAPVETSDTASADDPLWVTQNDAGRLVDRDGRVVKGIRTDLDTGELHLVYREVPSEPTPEPEPVPAAKPVWDASLFED